MHTIRHLETVCCYPNYACRLVEPPHLFRQCWGRSEILSIPICGISEIYLAVAGVDGDIVERVELPAKEIVEDHCDNDGQYIQDTE